MPKKSTLPTFADALRARIDEDHLTGVAAAALLEVDPSRISRYLNGTDVPSLASVERVARFLHVTEADVMDMIRRHGSRRGTNTNRSRADVERIAELEAELAEVRKAFKAEQRETARLRRQLGQR